MKTNFVLVGIVGALALAGCDHDAQVSKGRVGVGFVASIPAPTTVPPTTQPAPPATVPVPLPPPTTQAPKPVSEQEAMAGWYAKHSHHLETIPVDAQRASEAANNLDTVGLGAACKTMLKHLREAKAAPPVPVSSVNRYWQLGLDSFIEGADLCVKGIALTSPSLINQSTIAMREGNDYIRQATDAIEGLT